MTSRIREIPYNYTSFSDREIILRFLGGDYWEVINDLRSTRKTGRSARMLFEVLGDLWVVARNPYLQDDLINNPKRLRLLVEAMNHRLGQIRSRADGNIKVLDLIGASEAAVKEFETEFQAVVKLRKKIITALANVTKKDNIDFGGLARISHATDASDWRVELPFAVITPDTEEEVADIARELIQLKIPIIPRGGGTGYTGSAVPLNKFSAVLNTEKLESIGPVVHKELPGVSGKVPVVRCGAGVVTRRVAEHAEDHGLVFAVDPTSWDASTIGGNISMNAGGKKAVIWGTALDNLVSWQMVMPDGQILTVERQNHNLGKIHDQKDASFKLTYRDPAGNIVKEKTMEFDGQFFRTKGLGKDVTDKALGGLPGMQKEGTDGIIISGEFILHKMPAFTRTVCLEFHGSDMRPAVSCIVEVKNHLDSNPDVVLTGLEHLDERYVRAVGYASKSARGERPKMVLLADVSGENDDDVAKAASSVVRLASKSGAEGFIAASEEARKSFWKERSKTAAIAAHTNAFKINEDVVIPLEKLADYSEGIETINIEQSIKNKLGIIDAYLQYLNSGMPEAKNFTEGDENLEIFRAKSNFAIELLNQKKKSWSKILASFSLPGAEFLEYCREKTAIRNSDTVLSLLLRRDLRISLRKDIQRPLNEIFTGDSLAGVREKLAKIHSTHRTSRLFVATHMHAGDGNVHTNIPVNSNDYDMLTEAHRIVDRVMKLAVSLGGVISGEHGIGITKFQFLDAKIAEDFARYKKSVDPENLFNPGMLLAGSGLESAYTPSLRLVEQEALILEESELGDLNDMVRHCLRCGKCKPVCNTHIPRANLSYSPRNKILSTGLLIEAFLYEHQTKRGVSIGHWEEMNDLADHCTVCHKCEPPCPVNIDFGEVSIRMRNILRANGQKKTSPATAFSMSFLNMTDASDVNMMRSLVLKPGFTLQRMLSQTVHAVSPLSKKSIPRSTTGPMNLKTQLTHSLKKPLPSISGKALHSLLGIEGKGLVPILRDPVKVTYESPSVFYFPGCGSERLYPDIALASLAFLYDLGVQTVLPPEYLCCGYPQTSGGNEIMGQKITTDNRVLFHRIANTLNYLDIKTVLISCGTCMDQLLRYELEKIFPDCRLLDIHEYLMEHGIEMSQKEPLYLYHDPCHTPIKTTDPMKVVKKLTGDATILSERCCGEAGTLAVSRPDISTQIRYRKEEELFKGMDKLDPEGEKKGKMKILTSCPACIQGLSRYERETGLKTTYIVQELAENRLGKNWKKEYLEKIHSVGKEMVLL